MASKVKITTSDGETHKLETTEASIISASGRKFANLREMKQYIAENPLRRSATGETIIPRDQIAGKLGNGGGLSNFFALPA